MWRGQARVGSSQALRGGLWQQFQAEWTPLPSGPDQGPLAREALKERSQTGPELDKAEQTLKPSRVLRICPLAH